MKKILVYTPDPYDGIGYYRTVGPLIAMKDDVRVQIFPNEHLDKIAYWHWYNDCDLVLINKPYKIADIGFMIEAKKWDVPVWLDIDDLLNHMTPGHGNYQTFMNEDAQKIFVKAIELADVVSVSTEYLKTFIATNYKPQRVIVLENAMNDKFVKHKKPFKMWNVNIQRKQVLWRGSEAHAENLHDFEMPILEVINSHPDWTFIFQGMKPYWLESKFTKANVEYVRTLNIRDYIQFMGEINAPLHYVALTDNSFNRAKSDIAWLEATLAGSAVLAPDFESWNKPCIETYRGNISFMHTFDKMLQYSDSALKTMNELSWEYIIRHRLLSQVNKLRLELINYLVKE